MIQNRDCAAELEYNAGGALDACIHCFVASSVGGGLQPRSRVEQQDGSEHVQCDERE
jgi:hypothetical protein